MLFELDEIQKETVEYALKNPYSILALDMGLGKTACALAIWEKVRGNLLVVCPAYLILNWVDEIKKFLGPEVLVTVIKKGTDIYYIFDSDICLVSYDLAQKAENLFEWATIVVSDEGQELKSMKAKRTQFFHRVVYENSIPRLHILTGTPIKNRVEEYYSLLALMNYSPSYKESKFLEKFPDSITFADYFSHRHEYTMEINNKYFKVVKWEGVRKNRIDELKSYLKGHYIRFSGEGRGVELRSKDILISESADKKLLMEFENHYHDESTHGVDASAKALAALNKVPFTVKYVNTLLEELECIPIYTDHTMSCEALAKAFGVPAITGKMSPARRIGLGKAFQRGESRVICATVKSFSTGISLTRANNLVLNDFPWVPGDIAQVVKRIKRRDQTKNCLIHRILGSPQDAHILKTVESKQETIDLVT